MLSYQHMYHAGNKADMHKHRALAVMLELLAAKNKPLTYMETHAGRGLYDLTAPEAQKTGEAAEGILKSKISELAAASSPYYSTIERIRKKYGATFYPGSPLFAKHLLRPTDTIQLMELHPQEHSELRRNLHSPNVHIHKRDGYEGVLAISPPQPRRGMVMIDPSYEVKTEYDTAAEFIRKLHRKWAEATILLWYPILKENYHQAMTEQLTEKTYPNFWQHEVRFETIHNKGMLGSGLVCINLPYGADKKLQRA